ncbi:MAG TPA: 2-oxo-4-hydroxy-4-carboxy-5-ureidoimidazoline decarboxylase [Pyrinomonadaceae bacterium]|nr:2-oxo-4-hydroxy-4-carboxy-5-ureidoimidazoline decarboxylase [Pyrinomonadaceae bacterium]
MVSSLNKINSLSSDDAEAEFLKCCGSSKWAQGMVDARPFPDAPALFDKADALFSLLSDQDWLEAFRAHPKIGERKAATAQSQTAQNWSAQEQAKTAEAGADVMSDLARGNREYEQRFGFIFIVCASGKTAEEMLAMLNRRLANDAPAELRIAAEEQKKITRLRLEKLLQTSGA